MAVLDGIWSQRLGKARMEAGKGAAAGLLPSSFTISDDDEYLINGEPTLNGQAFTDKDWEKWKQQAEAASDSKTKSPEELAAEAAIAEINGYRDALTGQKGLQDDPNAPKVPDKNAPGTKGNPIKVDLGTFMAALASQESSSGYRPKWATAPITQGFGPTNEPLDAAYGGYEHFNKGIDYGIPVGTPIDAAVGGTVISAGDAGDGWGISVKVMDANGLTHNYGHLDSALVKPGDKISAGIVVGNSGDTGKSTGPHLSYDVWDKDRKFIDPANVIAADGGYTKQNARTGAFGRYQILPRYWAEFATAAGVPDADPRDPAMQEYVTEHRLGSLFEKYKDWNKVAAAWYAGETGAETKDWNAPGVNGEPSIQEYVNSVMGKVETAAIAGSQGTLTPGGTYVTGGSGTSSSSSGGIPKKPDPLKDYLESGEYKLEGERADEMDRRYDNIAARMKDYGIVAGDVNALLKNIQDAIGNEVALKKANQQIQEGAIKTASEVNAGVKAGKLDYRDSLAGPIWSNSLSGLEKELQAIRAAMQTAPEGFADSILRTIPKTVPMEYYVDNELGLPGYSGDYWGQPSQARYALGTIPRYAAGTLPFHLEPYLAAWQSGKYVPSQIARQFEEAGYSRTGSNATPANTTTPTTTTTQPTTTANSTYRPGYVPKNATLPPDMRVFDDGEWLDRAVSTMIMNISAGKSATPASWGLGDLSAYHGMPASNFDGGLVQALRSAILANKNSPEIIQAFGAPPGIETQWVPDPSAPPTKATPGTGGGGNYGTGANTQAQYGGTYGGSMDPYDSARIDLEKQQLALQRQVAESQIKLDRERFELEKLKNVDAQAYQAAQIRWNDAKALLDQKSFDLSVTQQALQKTIFEDSVRRYEIETGMAREKLDLDKIRQESDILYQSGQLELARQAGALNQAEYEEKKRQFELQFGLQRDEALEKKRQFELTFGYQKEKDKKEQDMQRAKITVDYMSRPGNAVASNFWYGNQPDPVGTTYDLFTGEQTGNKTWQQMYEEDAVLYADAMKPVPMYADGSMDGFMHDVAAILGDSKSSRATGHEEVVYNPTGAPLMVLSNEMSRALGFVPNRGKQFGNHVRKGGAA